MDYEHVDLEDRVRAILFAIIDNYINTVEPVGSRTLSRIVDLGLSPATIRNVMADLTDQGLLAQPHTSAGRVPTNQAYRYYVDSYQSGPGISEETMLEIEQRLSEQSLGLTHLLSTTTKMLSDLTQFTGIVASPRVSNTRLRLIEFIRMSDTQIYVVLITESNMVYHKILEVSEPLPQDFLSSVSRFLNDQFVTCSLEEARERVLESLVEEKEHYDQLLAQVVRLSKRAFDLSGERQLFIEGQSLLVREFDEVEEIQSLLGALEEKIAIVDLLDQTLDASGVHVAIGRENPIDEFQNCALVTAKYGNGDNVLGAIGVIGPTWMDYFKIMPIIDYTAKKLSAAISNQ